MRRLSRSRSADDGGEGVGDSGAQGDLFEISHGGAVDGVDLESSLKDLGAAVHFLSPYVIVFTNAKG